MSLGSVPRSFNRILAILCALALLGSLSAVAPADDSIQEAPRSKGVQCLFAGHSFFCPVAVAFNQIARQSDFPEHDMKLVFRGGMGGTASALWSSTKSREAVEAVLATGEVELFGLTPDLRDNVETFERWFDLALTYNPKTRFFIGVPWSIRGHAMNTRQFDQLIESYAAKGAEIVTELRLRYPDNRIDYLAYGKVAPAMKTRFEAGTLSDITQLVGTDQAALFSDNRLGHAGPLLLKLCALTWLDLLYNAKLDSLDYGTHGSDVSEIVTEVLAFNAPYRTTPEPVAELDQNPEGTPAPTNQASEEENPSTPPLKQ